MSPQNTVRDWARLLYYLSQNTLSLIGVVLTTSSAITLIGFWMYDFMLPGPPHPYVGILLFLILPGLFVLGLLLIPIGIGLLCVRLFRILFISSTLDQCHNSSSEWDCHVTKFLTGPRKAKSRRPMPGSATAAIPAPMRGLMVVAIIRL